MKIKHKSINSKRLFSTPIIVLLAAAVVISTSIGCAKHSSLTALPENWHQLPEDQTQERTTGDLDEETAKLAAAHTFEQFITQDSAALEKLPKAPPTPELANTAIPWHLEYFITDLAVSAQGFLAGLFLKGTPAITLIWRHQNPTRSQLQSAAPQPVLDDVNRAHELQSAADFVVTDETPQADLNRQLEPAIRAAVASGRVQNESALRGNLQKFAQEFKDTTRGLNENPGLAWWVQRYRVDLVIDASGHVMPTVTVGGNLRFRFEWHRIMSKRARVAGVSNTGVPTPMQRFAYMMSQDLATLSEQPPVGGFRAYTFRVGIGVTATAQIGIVKGSAGLLGHVYFARDIAAPTKRALKVYASLDTQETIPVIEGHAPAQHLQYASLHSIPFSQNFSDGGTVYEVNRSRLRSGLRQAAQMGSYFAARAQNPDAGGWKIYEMRTGFDLSIGGTMPIVSVSGTATTEINFYNTSF